MTRKDYVAIAAAIKGARQSPTDQDAAHEDALNEVADNLAEIMAADNPRFDRARFLKACGLSD